MNLNNTLFLDTNTFSHIVRFTYIGFLKVLTMFVFVGNVSKTQRDGTPFLSRLLPKPGEIDSLLEKSKRLSKRTNWIHLVLISIHSFSFTLITAICTPYMLLCHWYLALRRSPEETCLSNLDMHLPEWGRGSAEFSYSFGPRPYYPAADLRMQWRYASKSEMLALLFLCAVIDGIGN